MCIAEEIRYEFRLQANTIYYNVFKAGMNSDYYFGAVSSNS